MELLTDVTPVQKRYQVQHGHHGHETRVNLPPESPFLVGGKYGWRRKCVFTPVGNLVRTRRRVSVLHYLISKLLTRCRRAVALLDRHDGRERLGKTGIFAGHRDQKHLSYSIQTRTPQLTSYATVLSYVSLRSQEGYRCRRKQETRIP